MISDELAIKLHHRAVLENNLSGQEAAQLQEWSEEQDRLEMEMLGLNRPQPSPDELNAEIETLQALVARLETENAEIVAQNQALSSEIARLKQRRAERSSPQPV